VLTINHREGAWIKPDTTAGWGKETGIVLAGIVISAIMIYFHRSVSGIQLLG